MNIILSILIGATEHLLVAAVSPGYCPLSCVPTGLPAISVIHETLRLNPCGIFRDLAAGVCDDREGYSDNGDVGVTWFAAEMVCCRCSLVLAKEAEREGSGQ